MSDKIRIRRTAKSSKKVRWNGWLSEDNYDYVAREAIHGDRSMASVLNQLIRELRQQNVPRG